MNHMRDSARDPSPRTRREQIVDVIVLTVIVGGWLAYWLYVLVFA